VESPPVTTGSSLDDRRQAREEEERATPARAGPIGGAGPDPDWLNDDVGLVLLRAGLPAAAKAAGVSESSLRRRLYRHGTTVRAVVASGRRRLMVKFLSEGIPTERVARLVGLSGLTSLWRFSRREFGLAPSELRTQVLKDRVSTGQVTSKEK
jgi:AraC-like DNA-binding protein